MKAIQTCKQTSDFVIVLTTDYYYLSDTQKNFSSRSCVVFKKNFFTESVTADMTLSGTEKLGLSVIHLNMSLNGFCFLRKL